LKLDFKCIYLDVTLSRNSFSIATPSITSIESDSREDEKLKNL